MNQKKLTPANCLLLDTLNGLLVGLVLEQVRIAYLDLQMTRFAREYVSAGYTADFESTRWEPVTILASMLVFALVGYSVRQYFMNRPYLLLSLWLGLGSVALVLGYFMSTRPPDVLSYLWLAGLLGTAYPVHRLWRGHPDFPSLLWPVNGISAVVVVALGVQLVGLFFYWPDLRKPMIWLVGLVGVIAINAIFGIIVQFVFHRVDGRDNEQRVSYSP